MGTLPTGEGRRGPGLGPGALAGCADLVPWWRCGTWVYSSDGITYLLVCTESSTLSEIFGWFCPINFPNQFFNAPPRSKMEGKKTIKPAIYAYMWASVGGINSTKPPSTSSGSTTTVELEILCARLWKLEKKNSLPLKINKFLGKKLFAPAGM